MDWFKTFVDEGIENATLGGLIRHKASENKKKVFLFFEDQAITFEEMEARSNRLGNALLALGVKKGDHVALMMPNCPDWLYAFFGLTKIGAVLVAINTNLMGEGLKYVLTQSDASRLIINQSYLGKFQKVRKEINNIKHLMIDAPDQTLDLGGFSEETTLQILLSSTSSDDPPPIEVVGGDPAEIIYTSGTTGLPKGVLKTHAQVCMVGRMICSRMEYTASDTLYNSFPLYHMNAQMSTVLAALYGNSKVALARRFSASRFWNDIRKYQATEFNYVGGILPILYKHPEGPDDGDNPVKKAFGGGAPKKEIWEAFEKRFNLKLVESFGSLEGCATFNWPDRKIGSVGKADPLNEVRIFDEEDNECPPHTIGEFVSRPTIPGVKLFEYYKMPEETAEKVRGGWFRTGDLGYYDEDDFFFFAGRKKDNIRIKGVNISAHEIESVIDRNPAVLESAAVSVESEIGDEEVKLCIVLKKGSVLTPKEVIGFCQDKMAYYMVPRYVEFLASLPKTGTEKIQKNFLRNEGVTPKTWDRLGSTS